MYVELLITSCTTAKPFSTILCQAPVRLPARRFKRYLTKTLMATEIDSTKGNILLHTTGINVICPYSNPLVPTVADSYSTACQRRRQVRLASSLPSAHPSCLSSLADLDFQVASLEPSNGQCVCLPMIPFCLPIIRFLLSTMHRGHELAI